MRVCENKIINEVKKYDLFFLGGVIMEKYVVKEGVIEFDNRRDYERWETLNRIVNNLKELKLKLDWSISSDLDIPTQKLQEFWNKFEEVYNFYLHQLIQQELKGLQ